MNILFCSAGRRVELIKEFKKTIKGNVIVTDHSRLAPALYEAHRYYLVPLITDESYIDVIIDICRTEKIDAIATLIDPEIEVLAKNRKQFENIGVCVLAPDERTALLCFDKFKFVNYLSECGIRTVKTFGCIQHFNQAFDKEEITFPIFVKPRTGSGSVGARKIENIKDLTQAMREEPELIIQEYMGDAVDLDADVYIDAFSHKAVSIFSKRKLEKKIGGASKTVSFHDGELIDFIKRIVENFSFQGAVDMDFFYKNGKYYLSEINPRFGGAYIHAFEAGIDFIKLIERNVGGFENQEHFGNYEEGLVMMMYDSLVVRKMDEVPSYPEEARGGYCVNSKIMPFTSTSACEERAA